MKREDYRRENPSRAWSNEMPLQKEIQNANSRHGTDE